jgi:phage shock protein PspC (stress-responsive transcriptional regulator)
MKEIARIHIAKVTYDIEVDAKKILESYILNLEAYAQDDELLNDIETRITELLADRGVKPKGVITKQDVVAIREQLGEPEDFMDEGDVIVAESDKNTHKLYRNLDNGLFGGVLSGIASYFGINALWTRLIFIALLFISFGLAALLYLLLWLILPAASTAAEKLQMEGRPVTLTSIRELNVMSIGGNSKIRRALMARIAGLMVGIAGIIAALATVAIGIVAWIRINGTIDTTSGMHGLSIGGSQTANLLPVSFVIAGMVLLVLLFILISYAAFSRKFSKRIWISGLVIIVLGLGSAITAASIVSYQYWQHTQEVARSTVDTSIKLPTSFNAITAIELDSTSYVTVNYVVDPSNTSMTISGIKGLSVEVLVTGTTAHIKFPTSNSALINTSYPMVGLNGTGVPISITVHGPKLDSIISNEGYVSYMTNSQDTLTVVAHKDSNVTINASTITNIMVTLDGAAQLTADNSSIEHVTINLGTNTYASFGNIKALTLNTPDACGSNAQSQVTVKSIKNTMYTHNGQQVPSTHSSSDSCSSLSIGSDAPSPVNN